MRAEQTAVGRPAGRRQGYLRIQEERRQLRDLIASLAPYRPGGLDAAAMRSTERPAERTHDGRVIDDRMKRSGALNWIGPLMVMISLLVTGPLG